LAHFRHYQYTATLQRPKGRKLHCNLTLMYKIILAASAILAVAAMLGSGLANAQTYNYSAPAPAQTQTPSGGSTGSQTTPNMNSSSGSVNGTSTAVPGVPNTGAGGDAYPTALMLIASATLVVMGAISLRQLRRDVPKK
jgi:hypothetical protein